MSANRYNLAKGLADGLLFEAALGMELRNEDTTMAQNSDHDYPSGRRSLDGLFMERFLSEVDKIKEDVELIKEVTYKADRDIADIRKEVAYRLDKEISDIRRDALSLAGRVDAIDKKIEEPVTAWGSGKATLNIIRWVWAVAISLAGAVAAFLTSRDN